jgi:hypothetical protein
MEKHIYVRFEINVAATVYENDNVSTYSPSIIYDLV